MAKEESLITAYILDGQGSGRRVNWSEINNWQPEQGLLWVHLNYRAKRTCTWVKKYSKLDKITAASLLSEETRPRALLSKQGILVLLRGVNLNPGQDPEDMVSIRIWLSESLIITTRERKLLSIGDVEASIASGQGPKNSGQFLVMLNNRMLDRMSTVIDNFDEQIDTLEEQLVTLQTQGLRPKVAELRRQCIMIRRYLSPQREALTKIYQESHALIEAQERMIIRESNDRVIRYIEELDVTRERSAVTQEELSTSVAERMSERMYTLSVVAIIFMPLSFITGLLGINVGGIPLATNELGFFTVCASLVMLFALMAGLFFYKKWI